MKDWKLVLCGGGIALAGMVVGASLFGAHPAAAQRSFSRCAFARQPTLDVGDDGVIVRPGTAETIILPSGWTPIGGGGLYGSRDGVLVLCE